MPQIQCPNCGGYKVNVYHQSVGWIPGTCIEIFLNLVAIFVLPWIFGGIVGLMLFVAMGDAILAWNVALIAGAIATPFFIVMVLIRQGIRRRQVRLRLVPKPDRYVCSLCGKAWSAGDFPADLQVVPNPALISLGDQRLAEDEEKRRRRNLD